MSIQTIEIPREVLESAVLTSNNKDHRELCRTVVIVPNSDELGIYAVDGKRFFKASLGKADVNIPSPLTQPICLFSEKVDVALKQLKQSMGRNAKSINTILITYDPAKPFVALLSIGNTTGRYDITQALRELKVPVDLVDDKGLSKDIATAVENTSTGLQNEVKTKPASEEDKAKFNYYLPFINYLTKILNMLGEDYLRLKNLKYSSNNSLHYSFADKEKHCDYYIAIMGAYD